MRAIPLTRTHHPAPALRPQILRDLILGFSVFSRAAMGLALGWLLLCMSDRTTYAAVPAPVILHNEHVEVGVDPAHGLILGFGLLGKKNLLWVNPHPLSTIRVDGWIDYGGEKIWWGPQIDWQKVKGRRFPPDEALDGEWSVIAQTQDKVTMRSGVSPWVGIRAEREIALAPNQAGIVIHNRFTREQPSSQPLQLWTVGQMTPPLWCWLDSQPAAGEEPYVSLRPTLDPKPFVKVEAELSCVRVTLAPHQAYMIGTRGAWIAAVYDKLIVVHQVEPYPDGDYSENVSLMFFSAMDYIEMESLGGLANPAVGETMTNTVRWRILIRPLELNETELGHWLRQQLSAPLPAK